MNQWPSIKNHPQYAAAIALLAEGNSLRFTAEKLKIHRETVCKISRTAGLRGNK